MNVLRRPAPTLILAIALLALGTLPAAAQPVPPEAQQELVMKPPAPVAEPPMGGAAARLHDLFAREWEDRLERNPLLGTYTGRPEQNHRLKDLSPEAMAAEAEAARGFLAELDAIAADREAWEALSPTDRVSADIFRAQLTEGLEEYDFRTYEVPILADEGFHISFARMPREMPFQTAEDYENYLSRLWAWPKYAEQNIANMRAGLARGMTLPQVVLDGYEVTIDSHVVERPEDSLFFEPFTSFPTGVPESERARLVESGKKAVMEAVVPGYRTFSEFMTEEYIPGARTTLGASELPRGKEYYEQRIKVFTTLPLTAEEIHQTGLAEVKRIRAEMEEIIEEVGFEGSFDEFLTFLRTDPRFYPETGEELLKEASYIAKRMDAKLPALFGKLPRLPYGVAPVPDHLAPKYTAGRYVDAPKGSTQPGYYWVNTYNLPSRTLYTLEALTLHEAVPGHHLQMALNQELEGLPPFRRFSYISAFGEGWGLYSEYLGLEAGFYTDPYSNFGRLTYEMWRACRLVVDTGLHAFGWTRDQAMEFLASNTALSLHEVTTETDRYIAWPGQALAYKIGELKIKELRRRAEAELGEDFDIRGFHDTVLGNGSVPLPVLEAAVLEWIAAEKQAAG